MANNPAEDDWGDDTDDDLLMYAATQVLEVEEEKMVHENTTTRKAARGKEPSELIRSPTQANRQFVMRREHLQETQESEQAESMLSQDPQHLKNLVTKLSSEKSKTQKLKNDLLISQGESENLRRQVDMLRRNQQTELGKRLQHDREEKQKHDETIRQLKLQITALNTDLRCANDEITKAKSKSAMVASSGRLSVGGASLQTQTTSGTKQQYPSSLPAGGGTVPASMRFRSDPNLSSCRKPSPQQPQVIAAAQSVPGLPTKTKQITMTDKGIQANAVDLEIEKSLKIAFGEPDDPIRVGKFKSVQSMGIPAVKEKIFEKLLSLNHLELLGVEEMLREIANKAPNEITFQLVPGVAAKTFTCFPDITDSMYQWVIANDRKKEREQNGEIGVSYPCLPSTKNPGIINYEQVLPNLRANFVYRSAWDTLREIKSQLKKMLGGIDGKMRFRLYEITNLHTLQKLLCWSKEMWKFILFEEELDYVQEVGKELWIKELQEWSGIIMKIDWRDFYFTELEALIRQHCLCVLEYIVTTGYFEQLHRRYEILYCIIRDTMVKDEHRNVNSVRKCLSIVMWLIADKTIYNYLCLENNDGNCLAYILGEYVLKCFKETKDKHSAINLFICYCNLLEILAIEHRCPFTSKIARQNSEPYHTARDDVTHEENDVEQMAEDMMNSQFADSEKYKLEDDGKGRITKLNRNFDVYSWLCSQGWESDSGTDSATKPCQCRKWLLGSVFEMLQSILEMWKASFLLAEKNMDEVDWNDKTELQTLKEILAKKGTNKLANDDPETKRYQELCSKVESLEEFMIKCHREASAPSDMDEEYCIERTWDVELKKCESLIPNPNPTWVDEKRWSDDSLNYAIQRGVVLMDFCFSETNNIALAVGSDAYNFFKLVSSELRFYADNLNFTKAQRALIEKFTTLDVASEEIEEPLNEITFEDTGDLMPTFNSKKILEGLPGGRMKMNPFSDKECHRLFDLYNT